MRGIDFRTNRGVPVVGTELEGVAGYGFHDHGPRDKADVYGLSEFGLRPSQTETKGAQRRALRAGILNDRAGTQGAAGLVFRSWLASSRFTWATSRAIPRRMRLSMLPTPACLAAEVSTGRSTEQPDQASLRSAVCTAAARRETQRSPALGGYPPATSSMPWVPFGGVGTIASRSCSHRATNVRCNSPRPTAVVASLSRPSRPACLAIR